MDDDSGSGDAAPMADVFYNNSSEMSVSEPEPMSPESVDVKPVIRPSIIVPVKSKYTWFCFANVLISKQ